MGLRPMMMMQTIRRAICAVVLALVASAAYGQTPVLPGQKLAFDHDGVGVTRWEQRVDDGAWVVVTPARVGTTQEWRVPFLPLTSGAHLVAMRACYTAELCSDASVPLSVVSIVVVPPTGLRIVTDGPNP